MAFESRMLPLFTRKCLKYKQLTIIISKIITGNQQVRQEEENVLYIISGDMVQGSLIDLEYKGCSTMEIMNYLSPDVVSLGNHELDYGLPHLLFLEKIANFPKLPLILF